MAKKTPKISKRRETKEKKKVYNTEKLFRNEKDSQLF